MSSGYYKETGLPYKHGFSKGHKSFHTEESKRKISITNKKLGRHPPHGQGVDCPAWIKDRNLLKTGRGKAYDTKYKYWMLLVKKRDSWRCKINNIDCRGRLEAHHILGWQNYSKLRYDINNGITLCLAHHPRSRRGEVELSPYFQKLVAEVK